MIPDFSHLCSEHDLRSALSRRKSVQLYLAETRPDSLLGFIAQQFVSAALLGMFVLPLLITPVLVAQIFTDRNLFGPVNAMVWFAAAWVLGAYWNFKRGGELKRFRDRYRTSSTQTLTFDPVQQCVIAREEFPSAPELSQETRLTFKSLRTQIREYWPEPNEDTVHPEITVGLAMKSGASLKMQWANREVTRSLFVRQIIDGARVRKEAREFAELMASVGIEAKSDGSR